MFRDYSSLSSTRDVIALSVFRFAHTSLLIQVVLVPFISLSLVYSPHICSSLSNVLSDFAIVIDLSLNRVTSPLLPIFLPVTTLYDSCIRATINHLVLSKSLDVCGLLFTLSNPLVARTLSLHSSSKSSTFHPTL